MRNPETMNFDPTAAFELARSSEPAELAEDQLEEKIIERTARLEAFHEQLLRLSQDSDIPVEARPVIDDAGNEIESMISKVHELEAGQLDERLSELRDDLEIAGVIIPEFDDDMIYN